MPTLPGVVACCQLAVILLSEKRNKKSSFLFVVIYQSDEASLDGRHANDALLSSATFAVNVYKA